MLAIVLTLVILSTFVGATIGQLAITSNGVDYTDGTYYSPFGTRVSLLCQGGSGAMNWQVDGAIQRSNIPDSDSDTSNLFQSTVSNGQELVIKNLANNFALTYFCQDVDSSLPEVQVEIEEGVIITSVLSRATSVTLQWSPVQGASTLVIAACCVSSNRDCSSPVTAPTTLSTGSVTITGLEEFIIYLCLIQFRSGNVQIKTGTDKPSGPPLDVTLSAVNMNSVNLTWKLPSELDRNGLILSYSVQCLGEGIPGDTRTTEQTSIPFSDLQPGSSYACRVAASTVNGTGPYSAFSNTTTQEGSATLGQLTITSNGVDYTGVTYYSPFGTRVSLLCQGGSNWQITAGGQRFNISITTTSSTFQRPVGNGQELVITSLTSDWTVRYVCQDAKGSLPEVQVEIEEGVIITSVLSSSTSVTLQWSPVQGDVSRAVTAACCVSSNPDCSSPVLVSTTLSTGSRY